MRRNPFDELEGMLERISRQVEEGMVDGTGFPMPGSVAVDVADTGEEYVVTADLPGYETDDIELTLAEGTLTLEASREETTVETDETERDLEVDDDEDGDDDEDWDGDGESEAHYLRRERTSRSVSRRIRLPDPVDETSVSATHTNGVLTVQLPKVSPEEGSKRIDIE